LPVGKKPCEVVTSWETEAKQFKYCFNVTDGQSMFFYAGKDRETYKLGHIKIYSPTTQINQDVYDFVL